MSILRNLAAASAVLALSMGCGSGGGSTGTEAQAVSTNGATFPVFYDGKTFYIHFVEMPPGGETTTLAKNSQQNNIYQSDYCEENGHPFQWVIDAVPGDGMNPLWKEVQIVFNSPSDCRQLYSDTEILGGGPWTLVPTDEMYECAVVGAKPQ